jgi:hypothetical protein
MLGTRVVQLLEMSFQGRNRRFSHENLQLTFRVDLDSKPSEFSIPPIVKKHVRLPWHGESSTKEPDPLNSAGQRLKVAFDTTTAAFGSPLQANF